MDRKLASALALVVGVLLLFSGSAVAQPPSLTLGGAPHTGTLYSIEAIDRFEVDLSGGVTDSKEVIVVVESCVEGVEITLEAATTNDALDLQEPQWQVTTGFSAGYATLAFPTPQSGSLFVQVRSSLAPATYTIAVNVDALPSIGYDASVTVDGVASDVIRARVMGSPSELASAQAFIVASDDATVPEIWSYCFLSASTSPVTPVDVEVEPVAQTDDAITYIATVAGLARNTTYRIVLALTDTDGNLVVAPIESATTLPVDGCAYAANLPFCSDVHGPVYVGTSGVTVLDLDKQAEYSFGNFSGALSHYNCETVYSPVRTCANCSDAYRQWVCATRFHECTVTPVNASLPAPFSHILKPCTGVCWNARQSCPSFLLFECPVPDSSTMWASYRDCNAAAVSGPMRVVSLALAATLVWLGTRR